MKIFHCADMHLDSPFSGLDVQKANDRRREMTTVFTDMMKFAREKDVSAVLIAGDLFDGIFCSEQTRREVFEALGTVGCPVIISPGNHDHYVKGGVYSDIHLPENVYVFKSCEMGRFDFDRIGISVFGYAFTSGTYEKGPLSDMCSLSEKNINLLCAHTDIRYAVNKIAPINAEELGKLGFTYAALGHVHMPPAPKKYGTCTVAYSGFAQGRGFDELGRGGANLVEISDDGKNVKVERVSFSKIHYEIEKLDVTGCDRDTEVINKIGRLIRERGFDADTALRVIIFGAVNSSYTPSKHRIEADAGLPHLAMIEVKDETSPVLDLEYLEKDKTLRGEFYRQLLPMLNSADVRERKCASLALKYGLASLDRREIAVMSEGSDDGEE